MARAELTVEVIDVDGAFRAETDGDTVDGHFFKNRKGVFLVARNADGAAAHTVTIITPKTLSGLAVADAAISVPLSATRYIGPFDSSLFDQTGADVGKVFVDVDSTQLKLTVYRIP